MCVEGSRSVLELPSSHPAVVAYSRDSLAAMVEDLDGVAKIVGERKSAEGSEFECVFADGRVDFRSVPLDHKLVQDFRKARDEDTRPGAVIIDELDDWVLPDLVPV